MKSPFIVITLTFVIVMLVVSSISTSVFSAMVSSSLLSSNKLASSSSSPQAKIHFDTNTTIKDIVAIHNSGIPFDKYVAKISAAAKGQNAVVTEVISR